MRSSYKHLGEYIEIVTRVNSDLKYGIEDVRGCSNTKKMMQTRANLIGRTYEKFIVLKPQEFIFNRRTTRNGERIGMAYNDTDREYIFTNDYVAFRVRKECLSKLLPEYLYLFFCRDEFDRYARYKSTGSATEFFNWEDMCAVPLEIPEIEFQKTIVKTYQIINQRIENKRKINNNLEEQAVSFYKIEQKAYGDNEIINGTISDIGEFVRGKNITAEKMIDGDIPVISAGLQPSGYHNQSNVSGPSITVSGSGVNAGYVSFHLHDIWAADCSYNNSSKFIHCLYVILKDIQFQINELQKGTAQPHVYPKELNPFEISFPCVNVLERLELRLQKIFALIEENDKEISVLQQMQKALLTTLLER